MRRQKVTEKAIAGRSEFWKIYFFISAAIGLGLFILQIDLYRLTLIKTPIPLTVCVFSSLLSFLIFWKKYSRTYPSAGAFFAVAQAIFSWGFIVTYIFMAANFYLGDKTEINYLFPIEARSSMSAGKHSNKQLPLITINYFGLEKDLVFGSATTENMAKGSDSVEIRVSSGFLGYDILRGYKLLQK